MSDLGAQVNELGGVQKQKDSLAKWIENMNSNIDECLQKQPKYRQEALQTEMKMISEYQETLFEKQTVLNEVCPDDNEMMIAMEALNGKINDLMDKRVNQQSIIEDFRYYHQDCQNWLEKMSKSLTDLDEDQTLSSTKRLELLQSIIREFEEIQSRTVLLKEKG